MTLQDDERTANRLTKVLIVTIAAPSIFIAASYLVSRTVWFLLRFAGYLPERHRVATPIIAVVLFAGVVAVAAGIIRLMWPGRSSGG